MSIYNENEDEIKKSVESILNQTFHDFEFIIVIDNPSMYYVENILKSYNDDRLICLKNESNIGLAMSMNKAASIAKGKYIARMDADDISDIHRLKIEFEYLQNNKEIDLVCCEYHYINEDDEIVNFHSPKINFKNYKKILPYTNMIHHPTILMKKELFDSVQGYRNFPCTQDYDLWLRLLSKNAKFAKIDRDLFAYRIRKNSTWKSNGMKQQVCFFYIRKLYKERCKNGYDSFSMKCLNQYLKQNGVTAKGELVYKTSKELLLKSKEYLKQKRLISCFFYTIKALFPSKFIRKEVKYKIFISFLLKYYER